jgi:hypothetical protein
LDNLVGQGEPSAGKRGRVERSEWWVIGATFVVSALGLALAVPATSNRPANVPLTLDSQLDRLPPGTPVLNDYALGGWISWRHPDLNQYIDGLATPYSPQHDDDFHVIENQGGGWYRMVLESGAPVALVETDSSLAHALERRGWERRGTDVGYVLLSRPPTEE